MTKMVSNCLTCQLKDFKLRSQIRQKNVDFKFQNEKNQYFFFSSAQLSLHNSTNFNTFHVQSCLIILPQVCSAHTCAQQKTPQIRMLFILLPQKQFYSTLCDQMYHNVFITKLKRVCLMAYTVLLHKNPIQTFAQVMHGFSHMHNSLQTKDTRDKEGFMYQTESSISLC